MCQRFCSIPSNLVSSDRKDEYKHHLPTSAVGSMFPEILTSSNRAKICDSLHKIAEKVMNIPPTAHNKKPLQKYLNTKSSSNSKRIIHIHRQHQEHLCKMPVTKNTCPASLFQQNYLPSADMPVFSSHFIPPPIFAFHWFPCFNAFRKFPAEKSPNSRTILYH